MFRVNTKAMARTVHAVGLEFCGVRARLFVALGLGKKLWLGFELGSW